MYQGTVLLYMPYLPFFPSKNAPNVHLRRWEYDPGEANSVLYMQCHAMTQRLIVTWRRHVISPAPLHPMPRGKQDSGPRRFHPRNMPFGIAPQALM